MTADMNIWRKLVVDEVNNIANEDQQRRSWFGIGPNADSPDEQFCAFFDNASVPEFLERADNGLNAEQKLELTILSGMMRYMSDVSPDFIKPADLIDDPRWQAICRQAKITAEVLAK